MTEVGWRLAEEVAWARPQRPGPEWWTLMDIAQDAKDDTRQGYELQEMAASVLEAEDAPARGRHAREAAQD